ncbi:MAG: HD domain-containing protein [Candidatus Omnitrophica bacterium]|nr:HD domain-containing protein [Candidatus Omnitrophota bacterium]
MNNSLYSFKRLKKLANKLERGSDYTPCHSENVANYARDLCSALNIRGKKKDMIITACLIHDIGKIGIDTQLLIKKGKLKDSEWLKIKMHPALSAILAKEANLSKGVVETIYYHHVWFNGNGYPQANKKGTRIPIGARIMAVCDAYETMTSKRSYKDKRFSKEAALEELRRYSATQFDPSIVEAFVNFVRRG